MVRHLLTLARLPNIPTVWSNVLAAWVITGGPLSWRLLPVLLGGSLFYAAGCTLNDAFDAAWDARNRPERPIPSGQLHARTVWAAGVIELLAGVICLYAAGLTHAWLPVALAITIVTYDAWHKQSPLSVVIMGACRALLYVAAGSAALVTVAGPARFPLAIAAAAVMWLYIVVLSLVARGEASSHGSAASRVHHRAPRSRLFLLTIPVAVAGLEWMARGAVTIPFAGVIALLMFGLLTCAGRRPVPQLVSVMLALIPILDALLIIACGTDTARWLWLPAMGLLSLLSRLLQRAIPAT